MLKLSCTQHQSVRLDIFAEEAATSKFGFQHKLRVISHPRFYQRHPFGALPP